MLARLISDIARAKANSSNWRVTNNGTAPAARLRDLDQNSENIATAGDSENFTTAGDRVAITMARRQGGRSGMRSGSLQIQTTPTPTTRARCRTMACGSVSGLLLQSFLTSLLDLLDLSGDEAQPHYIALQLSQCIWRQRRALRGV